jgi:hypothetical protein
MPFLATIYIFRMVSFLLLAFFLVLCNQVSSNAIVEENSLTGTKSWWYPLGDKPAILEGFSTQISYLPLDAVEFKLQSPKSIPRYSLEIYRLGYYGGLGGRLLSNQTVSTPKVQPKCSFEELTRTTDCRGWSVSAVWKIPEEAISGVYVALPVYYGGAATEYGTYIPFVVRRQPQNTTKTSLLFKTSDLTWVAYNQYGGRNVYGGVNRALKASYNRPFQNRLDSVKGATINFLFGAEFPFLFWLEKHGYDVAYCACGDVEDMHSRGELVPSRVQALLSVGHDEYWTPGMKSAYESARDAGVHLAFFGANNVYWRVRWNRDPPLGDKKKKKARGILSYFFPASASNTAVPSTASLQSASSSLSYSRRVIACAKETIGSVKPASAAAWTGTFRDPRHRPAEDESLLMGQWFMVNGPRFDSLLVTRGDAAMRFWRNTSFYVPSPPPESGVPVPREGGGSSPFSVHGEAEGSESAGRKHFRLAQEGNGSTEGASHSTPLTMPHPIHIHNDSTVVYRSAPGLLGYEVDAFPLESRPDGLFPLSSTTLSVQRLLLQLYGTNYAGSGEVTHRLSLYRYRARHTASEKAAAPDGVAAAASPTALRGGSTTRFRELCEAQNQQQQLTHVVGSNSSSLRSATGASAGAGAGSVHQGRSSRQLGGGGGGGGALVFATGTINWAWALSALHDTYLGRTLAEDRDIQQATLNLLADMGVLPAASSVAGGVGVGVPAASVGAAVGAATAPLVLPVPSTDVLPPSSVIQRVEYNASLRCVTVFGKARDFGGGAVAAVEVSLDGGATWHMAEGRRHWVLTRCIGADALASIHASNHTGAGTGTGAGAGIRQVEGPPEDPRSNERAYPTPPRPAPRTPEELLREHLHSVSSSLLFADTGDYSSPVGGGTYSCSTPRSSSSSSSSSDSTFVTPRVVTARGVHLVVVSRAVDDSGWMEQPADLLAGLCDVLDAAPVPTAPTAPTATATVIPDIKRTGGKLFATSSSGIIDGSMITKNVVTVHLKHTIKLTCLA